MWTLVVSIDTRRVHVPSCNYVSNSSFSIENLLV